MCKKQESALAGMRIGTMTTFSAFAALVLFSRLLTTASASLEVRGDLHFPLHARGTNNDGSLPIYKDPKASIEDRVNDLLPRMTLEEKVAQM